MLNKIEAKKLAAFIQVIDEVCREDLNKGDINNERDYVSHFMAYLRRPYGIAKLGHPSIARAITLPSRQERLFGADGLIVFRKGNESKQMLFEAKYCKPKQNNPWDYTLKSKSKKVSHFTDQLDRQRQWRRLFSIWEMFQNDYPNGDLNSYNFVQYGSTCVWHEDADTFANKDIRPNGKTWTNNRIKPLLQQKAKSINHIMYETLRCKKGEKLSVQMEENETSEYINVFSDKEIKIKIPLPQFEELLNDRNSSKSTIGNFMKKTGIVRYIYFDITNESLNYMEKITQMANDRISRSKL
ncbi:hypothetical protein [Alkalicoccus luteus]|uniref:hypothetical protein n=1 Tax=Alkalicoccus luteus TaxID=1237094 RepID=UPI004034F2DC